MADGPTKLWLWEMGFTDSDAGVREFWGLEIGQREFDE